MMTRLWLVEEHQKKDWRSLPFEEVKQFLFHLFGTTTPKSGTGIFVGKDGKGMVVATFKGQVDCHHLVCNGRAVSKSMTAEAKRLNAKILDEYNRAVETADREYHREMDQLRPFPSKQSPGATRPITPGHGSSQLLLWGRPALRGRQRRWSRNAGLLPSKKLPFPRLEVFLGDQSVFDEFL